MAESALEAFKSRGSEAITITGRTFDWCPLSRRKPDELAQKFDGFTLAYSKFHDSLHLFDVVLVSTASKQALLTREQAEIAMSKRPSKPLFLIDASVPRNVEELTSKVNNVFLYNMDDISSIANENLQTRLAEVDRCRVALSQKAVQLWEQIRTQASLPLLELTNQPQISLYLQKAMSEAILQTLQRTYRHQDHPISSQSPLQSHVL